MKTMGISLLVAIALWGAFTTLAQTWTQTSAPATNWISVASSADGVRLVAAVGGNHVYNIYGPIYTSTNSGITWVQQTNSPIMNWQAVASSAEGDKLIGIAGSKSGSLAIGSGIYTSTNGGLTWRSNSVALGFYRGGASSADGNILFGIGTSPGSLVMTTNAGITWVAISNNPPLTAIAASADGSRLVAGGISGPLYISRDFGVSWTNALSAGGWPSFASSADGTVFAGYGIGGKIYTSTNSGDNWRTSSVSPFTFQFLASSSDGKKLAAAVQGGGIYLSADFGLTWINTAAPDANWQAVACSADGGKLFAVEYGGSIWTSQTTPTPTLNIALTNDLRLSWTIPSTDLVLQQNSDLTTTNWLDVTNAPALNLTNLQNQVTLPLSGDNAFYRLKTP